MFLGENEREGKERIVYDSHVSHAAFGNRSSYLFNCMDFQLGKMIKEMTDKKRILDATCGSRMMWFDKENTDTLYCDIRQGTFKTTDGRSVEVNPDMVIDYRKMPFDDNSFCLIVFDPSHRADLTEGNWMHQMYGRLLPTWETDLKAGFDECMRVLKPNGTLIFKWNEHKIKTSRIINIIGRKPLFGHPTKAKTIWMTFIK